MTGKPKLVLLVCFAATPYGLRRGRVLPISRILSSLTPRGTHDGRHGAAILDGVNGSFSLSLSMGGYVAFEVMRRAFDGSTGWPCWTRVRAPTPGTDDPASGPD